MKNTWIAGILLASFIAPAAQAAELPNLAKNAADAYRARADFPEWSRLIEDAVDPLLRDRTPNRQRLADAQGAAPALEVWATQISYQPDQSVDLYARLDWLTATTDLSSLAQLRLTQTAGWNLQATLLNGAGEQLARLTYNDAGQGADALAGDGIYSARYTPAAGDFPALGLADNVMVKVHAQNPAGDVRKAVGGFLLSNPGAYLTGQYKQQVQDGNLVVLAQTEVLTAGRYHLSGTLANLLGAPVATAQNAEVLQAGTHWMALPYYGLIFHRLQQVAGLQLDSISLTSTNGMPNALGSVQRQVFDLQATPLSQLTQSSFADPNLLDAAKRLEASTTNTVQTVTRRLRRLGL